MSEINSLIVQSFDLAIGEDANEEDMLKLLTLRVTEMMAGDVDLLMSYLYRLDIEAEKINAVLSMGAVLAPSEGIARLILERQKERIATKKSIQVDPVEEGWEW